MAEGQHAPDERVSRYKRLIEDGAPIPLPHLESTYVVDVLFEIGPLSFSAMGASPLDDGHLRNWSLNNGVYLPPWLTRMIRRLSHDYLVQSHRAEKPDCPQPWEDESLDNKRERIAAQVRGALRAFK